MAKFSEYKMIKILKLASARPLIEFPRWLAACSPTFNRAHRCSEKLYKIFSIYILIPDRERERMAAFSCLSLRLSLCFFCESFRMFCKREARVLSAVCRATRKIFTARTDNIQQANPNFIQPQSDNVLARHIMPKHSYIAAKRSSTRTICCKNSKINCEISRVRERETRAKFERFSRGLTRGCAVWRLEDERKASKIVCQWQIADISNFRA